ncbi:Threonine/Serine exporter ThrE domain-containing protein [Alkalicoccus chagannorensis]
MQLITEILLTILAIVGFGILFSVPRRVLFIGGAIGGWTWFALQMGLEAGVTNVVSTVIASFTAASISHFLAKRLQIPVTTLSIPGILPLVPGSLAYFTMLDFVEGDYLGGLENGVQTMLQAGAIAAGLVLGLAVFSFGVGRGNRYEAGS